MNRHIFLSTNVFRRKDLRYILKMCRKHEYQTIELSQCNGFDKNIRRLLIKYREKYNFRFLLHNYFPPPKSSFVLNLASTNPQILNASRRHCKLAIDICADLIAPVYSVHAGACYDPRPNELGKKMGKHEISPKKEAQGILIESLQEISAYALKYNITIAIENHVLDPFHFIGNKYNLLFGVTADEILGIIKKTATKNLGVLIDVGHLKISAKTLNFSPFEFIYKLLPLTKAFHLSDNDGRIDEQGDIQKTSWFWKALCGQTGQDIFWTLEAKNCSIQRINKQIELIKLFS